MSNNIVSATVRIRGTRPLLWNAFTPSAIPLEKRERTGVAGNDPQEWKKTVLATAEGQLYVEPTYIFGCLRDGARHTKQGRGSIQSLVTSTLQVVDDKVLVDRKLPKEGSLTYDSSQPVYIDVRSTKNPATRARNVRYRVAAAPDWIMTFRIEWDATVVNREQMQAVIIDAGKLAGLGDGRTIGFGRFVVEEFKIDGKKD